MKQPRILIVGDEKRNIKLLRGILFRENYQIATACSGAEVLEAVAREKPDLIMLDVMMPGIDGFEVCTKLKQADDTKIIPIVMITALKEREHRIKAIEAGADDFLSKPVDSNELLVRVKSLLRIKAYHDELLESYKEIAEKNEKLLELEKIKEGLTHMIIHDLRNPLAALSGYMELILLKKRKLSHDQLQLIENSVNCCLELKEMIQGLLDIHKIEKGILELNKEETHLEDVIDEVVGQFNLKAKDKQIALSLDRSENMPLIQVDRSLMKRVIANLLNNAIRHTPFGGIIEIAAGPLQNNGKLHIKVKDNGDGLAPEYHLKVFDKFEQVNLKQAGITVGTCGLGLTLCKIAVEAHGGKIWVESEGEGATFQFTLPVNPHWNEGHKDAVN